MAGHTTTKAAPQSAEGTQIASTIAPRNHSFSPTLRKKQLLSSPEYWINSNHRQPTTTTPVAGKHQAYGLSFFEHLNEDVRALIYDYMELPPLGPPSDFLGFALSCTQAYEEARQASVRNFRRFVQNLRSESDARLAAGLFPSSIVPEFQFPADSTFAQLANVTVTVPASIILSAKSSTLAIFKLVTLLHDLYPLLARHFNQVTHSFLGSAAQPSVGKSFLVTAQCAVASLCDEIEEAKTTRSYAKTNYNNTPTEWTIWYDYEWKPIAPPQTSHLQIEWDLRDDKKVGTYDQLRGFPEEWQHSCRYWCTSPDNLVGKTGFVNLHVCPRNGMDLIQGLFELGTWSGLAVPASWGSGNA